MATSIEYLQYVVEHIEGAGIITYKKMFGEYLVYCDGKPVLLICDNTVFVKVLKCTSRLLEGYELAPPYQGAKPHFILENFENLDFLCELVQQIALEVPYPQSKRKKHL